MLSTRQLFKDHYTVAWLFLVIAVAVHVADEATSGFLPFYNDLVMSLRESLGFWPMPTFAFGIWLGGLCLGVAAGFALAPLVSRRSKHIRKITSVVAVLMALNACGHLLGSLYVGYLLPGFWSSPVLLLAALNLITRQIRKVRE